MDTDTATRFAAVGFSDVDKCDHCGREDLRRTVRIVEVDADGTRIGPEMLYGTTCAANATRRPSKSIVDEARAADHHAAGLAAEAREFVASVRAEWGTVADESPALFAADLAEQLARRAARAAEAGRVDFAAALLAA